MLDELISKIQDPGKEYRPVPFWSWNDKLDPEFLRWQVAEMDRVKLGGYFMHARGGLETEYLGDEWMQCIEACIEEGKKTGMNSWIYDEVGWPSGFAGGIVTGMGDKYHARGLQLSDAGSLDEAFSMENLLGVYIYKTVSNEIKYLKSKPSDFKLESDDRILAVSHVSGPYYIDVMNPEVVREFIKCTHEEYYKRFAKEFGTGIQGFFTDEPRFSVGKVPWSYIYADEFKRKYGYDIVEYLPALFIECKGYEKVRYDFWSLANQLFVNAFMKQIYEWCEDHNCKLTGHVMMEESLYSQMTGTAGSMPFYEYMQVPGIDWLRRMIGNPIIAKQVGSVASQLGKKQVLTESFALCGWNVSFEELKWIVDWQFVNGVNLVCQHLQSYTLRGLRKRDYPASLFYHEPWWNEYYILNDYLSRVGVALSSGKNAARVLMLHPMKSAWIAYNGTNTDALAKLDRDFIKACEILSGLHIDYHLGDETIMSKYACVNGRKLKVGQCEYDAVVMPSMLSIDASTVKMLDQFVNNGGRVISIGDFPLLSNGVYDGAIEQFKHRVIHLDGDKEQICAELEKASLRVISIKQDGREVEPIRYQHRDIGDAQLFFIVNHDQLNTYKTTVKINTYGKVKSINLQDGSIADINYSYSNGMLEFELVFLPMQSHLIVVDNCVKEDINPKTECLPEKKEYVKLGNEWDVVNMDLNSLTLDTCSYRIDKGKWEGPIAVIKLMELLLNMRKSCDIDLKFSFDIEMDLAQNRELYLIVEEAQEFEITVNGSKVEYRDIGWWKDSAFKKVDIKNFVKQGSNEIILSRRFYQRQKVYDVLFGKNVYETELNALTYDVELESIYLVGDFGVVSKSQYIKGERKALITKGPFVLTDSPQKLKSGDFTRQGLCFFAGMLEISQDIMINKSEGIRYILNLGKPNAVISKLFVNGKLVRALPWAPYEADITEFLKNGINSINIQLFHGNRNLLGPHHHIKGELYSVGPLSFTGKWSWVEKQTEGVPTDENERKKNFWMDEYCFVEFGLD